MTTLGVSLVVMVGNSNSPIFLFRVSGAYQRFLLSLFREQRLLRASNEMKNHFGVCGSIHGHRQQFIAAYFRGAGVVVVVAQTTG